MGGKKVMDYRIRKLAAPSGRAFLRRIVSWGNRAAIRGLPCVLFTLILFSSLSGKASAQESKITPHFNYFTHFNIFYDGDYADALKSFESDSRSCVRSGTYRWIDSICYETMKGECYYQMGMYDKALVCYTDALGIYTMYPDWMMRMAFANAIRPDLAGSRKQVPWGISKRMATVGRFPTTVEMVQGKTPAQNEQAVKQGGIVQQMFLYPVNPQEIIRCTALAMRRRAELLGPLSKNDPITIDLVSKTTGTINPANHWSEAWGDLERGLAYAAAGKDSQALPYLQRSVLAAGEFEHPLTCVALLELGRLRLRSGDYKGAAEFFEESTYAAANSSDFMTLEEAFQNLATIHFITNRQVMLPAFQQAMAWCKLKMLKVSLGMSLAENMAIQGNSRDALGVLDDVRAGIGRRSMATGRAGARLNYLYALVYAEQRKQNEMQKALNESLGLMKRCSLRLFHIRLADGYFVKNGGRTEGSRQSMLLYEEVLRDPLPGDWVAEPLETLAVLTAPLLPSYECWFESAVQRKQVHETAMEIADRVRRHRFYISLPLGGRLQSLRWILETPPEWLDKQAVLQRQDLLAHYPEYAKLAENAAKIRQKLSSKPLVTEDKNVAQEQIADLAELASICAQQEGILHEIALRREPADLLFPPLRKTQDIKNALPEGHAILTFFSTNRRTYAFLMNNAKYTSWEINAPNLSKTIATMLRDMGMHSATSDFAIKDLSSEKWKTSAGKLLDTITKNSTADFSKSFEELIIVPDGVLWYVPFEALQVTVDGKQRSLLSRFRIRYAPTLSLALTPYPAGRKAGGSAAVVWGKIPSRELDDVLKTAREKFESSLTNIVPLKTTPATSSTYSLLMNQLIVFDDLTFGDNDYYDWSPIPIDHNKPGALLSDWLDLPWGHPNEVVFTGFHTASEDSFKRLGKNSIPGNEIFLNACGLMAGGTRTILLSRWRTGGQTSCDLVREFLQELPHTSPADAWQRAVMLQRDERIVVEAEPRVRKAAGEEAPKAEHPFFWAGYMLFDGGQPNEKAKAPQAAPVPKPNPQANPPANPAPKMPGEKAKGMKK
jgi:CHAT domain-containing protein